MIFGEGKKIADEARILEKQKEEEMRLMGRRKVEEEEESDDELKQLAEELKNYQLKCEAL